MLPLKCNLHWLNGKNKLWNNEDKGKALWETGAFVGT